MGYTHKEAATALGLGVTTVSNYSIGERCDSGKVDVPKSVLLACAAVEQRLLPVN